MRSTGLGTAVFALIGYSIGLTAALAQPPNIPGSTSITKWFSGKGDKEKEPAKEPAAPTARPPLPQPHFLRQTVCNIPFTVDPSKNPPLELQLFVSRDRGGHWNFHSRANPGAGSFTFRASEDGEYWFSLRTIEKSKTPLDPAKLQPGLAVVIDTRQPLLSFDAVPNADGQVALKWDAADPNLDVDSLRVEYQADSRSPWQTLTIDRPRDPAARQVASQYLLRPAGATGRAVYRIEIRDRAGNNTVVSRQLSSPALAADLPIQNPPAQNPPAQNSPIQTVADPGKKSVAGVDLRANDGSVAWPSDNVLPPRAGPAPQTNFGELPPPKPSASGPPQANRQDLMHNPYFTASTQPSARPTDTVDGGSGGVTSDAVPHATAATPHPAATMESAPSAVSAPPPAIPDSRPVTEETITPAPEAGGFRPDTPNDTSNSPPGALPAAALPTGAPPTGERPRMTSTRDFSLDYEVEAIGPAAVERVELWGTADGGRAWMRWQDDQDRQSPIEVSVNRDGTYGFRIVVIASNQRATPTPQLGDPADIWISVDTTSPTARLTGAMYGEGEHAGQLDIRWQAVDTGFGDRPITLSFSDNAQGPWNTIAAGLPNSGQYYWLVEPRIPREIYLRIVAQDEVGNVGEHQLTEPISTAGLIPHAKIRGLRVPSNNSRSAARASTPH